MVNLRGFGMFWSLWPFGLALWLGGKLRLGDVCLLIAVAGRRKSICVFVWVGGCFTRAGGRPHVAFNILVSYGPSTITR